MSTTLQQLTNLKENNYMTSTQSIEILEFEPFKKLFQDNFTQVIADQTHLFQVNVDKDLLWNTYLNSFPEELRQQFNCNCCRQFIKNYGNLVAIKNNTLFSLWNFNALFDKRGLRALSDKRNSCKADSRHSIMSFLVNLGCLNLSNCLY